jgi:hypothetical protein
VTVGSGGGHLKLLGREERVRRLEIEEGGCHGGSSPRRGGGGFSSGAVDGELRHRRGQEAMGSSGGFVHVPLGGEKEYGGKKWVPVALGTF